MTKSEVSFFVMPALVAGIHVFLRGEESKTWMAGTSPAMTVSLLRHLSHRERSDRRA
jgi:hypothetical protein